MKILFIKQQILQQHLEKLCINWNRITIKVWCREQSLCLDLRLWSKIDYFKLKSSLRESEIFIGSTLE